MAGKGSRCPGEYAETEMPLLLAVFLVVSGDTWAWALSWIVFFAWFGCAAVTAAKGKWLLLAVDTFVWLFSYVGAFRLAKPGSVWARQRYDRDKMHRSLLRYGGPPSQFELEDLRVSS
jgi:hypothetical protein